jgi:CubicO group peptidase (beta-lactamase class C family)
VEVGGVGSAAEHTLPIASISKTLAAQCVLYLIDENRLSYGSTLSDTLGWSGPQGALTVKHLLTNSSGFGAYPSQENTGLIELSQEPQKVAQLVDEISSRPLRGKIGSFRYNNENWLILERVVEAVVGEAAFNWCRTNVPILQSLNTLQQYADLSAVTFSGGMSISAPDLARFFHNLAYQSDWPRARISKTAAYGPGIFISQDAGGQWLFHSGGYCPGGNKNIGALAGKLPNGVSVAMIYTGCAENSDIETLNEFMSRYMEK